MESEIPVVQKKKYTLLKALIITFLVLAISFLAIMQWKSDAIVGKVISMMQGQMADSLRYSDVSLEWLRYFPSAALRLEDINMGSEKSPFIQGGNVDVVLKLFPLLSERIVINRLKISDSKIYITRNKSRWSYEVFKKPDADPAGQEAALKTEGKSWEALVHRIDFENTQLVYNDRSGTSFYADIMDGSVDGEINGKLFDGDIDMSGTLDSLSVGSYHQAQSFKFEWTGAYKYDLAAGTQELKNWHIKNDGITLEVSGLMKKEDDRQWVDIHAAWNDGNPQVIKSLLPAQGIKDWDQYSFSGNSEGQMEIKGYSSAKESPRITFSSELKNGMIKFPGDGGQLRGIVLDVAYDGGEQKDGRDSYLHANLRNGSFQGNALTADLRMENIKSPILDVELKGAFPLSLLNLLTDPTMWTFKEGVFDVDQFIIRGFDTKTFSTKTFIEKSHGRLKTKDVRFEYNGDQIEIGDGDIDLGEDGMMKLELDRFALDKAVGENIEGVLDFKNDRVNFELKGDHSEGKVETKGVLSGWDQAPVLKANWIVKGIEMEQLLAAFENFDQTFLTYQNLKGKANVWTETIIPYDKKGNIRLQDVVVKAAVEINDGQLKDMKILQDFSKYVHLEDLKDIRFNTFRNYLKIEKGNVYCPVVFIQSSAMNLSVNGIHSFDQDILYNMKINAGQTAANKMKKLDFIKRVKQARKSGWINLYFVLGGTTSEVIYEQDQKAVISSFEQSAQMKEALRNYLVDTFGHDVYWIEPNEWEDIPEYQ